MHVEPIVSSPGQRQLRQKTPLRHAEPAARPLDRGLRFDVHGLRRGADGVIVVAEHGDGAVIDQVHHGIDRPFRIGAVANDIAEAARSAPHRARAAKSRHALNACRLAWISANTASLTRSSPSTIAPVLARVLMDIKPQAVCDVQSGGGSDCSNM